MGLGLFSSISKKRAFTKIRQMELQISDEQSDDLTKAEKEHINQINNILDEAQVALDNGKTEIAWQLLRSAQRTQLKLDPKGALLFKKNALYHEADQKLKNWRKDAILDFVENGQKKDEETGEKSINREALTEAYGVLHEHFSNIYTKNRSILKQLFTLSFTAFGALLAFLFIIWKNNMILDLPITSVLTMPTTFSVLLFGTMGACLSAIFSLAGGVKGIKIPKLQVNLWITLTRPVIGAISALVIFIFIISGILFPNQNLNTAGILSISFVAGFSERLIIRAVETVADNSKLNPQSE